jgi:dCTP deaminase
VLCDHELRSAVDAGVILADLPPVDEQFQPASLDLRLGTVAYQVRASFLPFRDTVRNRLQQNQADFTAPELVIDRLPLEDGATLQRGQVYLVPLRESLSLPRWLRGRCNPKSTTGRLDIFTRVITDCTLRFDEIEPGYRGPLYAEVSPQSFPVRVKSGISLSQLRLATTDDVALSDDEIRAMAGEVALLYGDDGEPVAPRDLVLRDGLCMGVDLSGRKTDGIIGYRAHPNPPAIDLTKVAHYDPSEYWEPIRESTRNAYILEANRFYILASKERVRVPPSLAAEMAVYDASAGEIRTHYAGFFDPGFGFGDGTLRGTKVVMEVRARDVPVMLYDGQIVFTVRFERLCGAPRRVYGAGLGSSYQDQGLTLSKQFRRAG